MLPISERSEVLRVKEKYEDYLLKIEGVTGIGVNGSIRIYVEKLTPQLARMLPRELDGIPVKIIETGKIIPMSVAVAHAIYADRTKRYRPAPGGVSVGHPQVSAGTLTGRAIDRRDGRVVGLSNNHVIALDWGTLHVGKKGDATLQPGPFDGGRDPEDKIGELKRWIPVRVDEPNEVDAAIFDSEELADYVQDIGKPAESVEPYEGMKVVKSGRTSGVTYGTITDVSATIRVDGWGVCIFKNQIAVEPAILSPGDSGSWVGEVDSWRTVGVGFAGSQRISFVNPALTVERLLDIRIIPPVRPIPAWAAVGVIGSVFLAASALKYEEVGGVAI